MKQIHFKKFGEFNSLEGKTNKAGIRYKDGYLLWNGLSLQVICDQNNSYELEAFQNDIAYCRVVRKWVRKKYKFYVQIVFKGIPPAKRNKETGHFKRTTGSGDVGLDIGLSTLAIVSEKKVKLLVLADRVRSFEGEKRLLLRKMDRSRRAMNRRISIPMEPLSLFGTKNGKNPSITYPIKENFEKSIGNRQQFANINTNVWQTKLSQWVIKFMLRP